MNILVIGIGYVGLVTGTCFAEMGHHVVCLDIDKNKVEKLKHGEIGIFEPGLDELVKRNIEAGRLAFTSDYPEAVAGSTVCFIAVDTPMNTDGSANLDNVLKVALSIGKSMEGYHIIVNKSTVPVGTAERVRKAIQDALDERGVSFEFDMVSNPEFLKEGDAINDFLKPDRVVIGTDNVRVGTIMKEIYSAFTLNHERIMIMDIPSAELTKYAANAMLALRISFMNELSELCEALGADITSIRKGIGSDQRIGSSFLYAGPGYGGSCFPKDINALSYMGKLHDVPLSIVDSISIVNKRQRHRVIDKILNYFESKKERVVAIWGLSFKPNTDDIRESPAIELVSVLKQKGFELRLFDPIALPNVKNVFGNSNAITYCKSELEAATGADAVVLMTEWRQFRLLNLEKVLESMRGNAFFDLRLQYKPEEVSSKGFDYFSLGRKDALSSNILEQLPV